MPRTLVSCFLFFAAIATLLGTANSVYGQHAHHAAPKVAPPATHAKTMPAPTASTLIGAAEKSSDSYRPFNPAEPLINWSAANDKVHEIGGWRAYAKEAARAAIARAEASDKARDMPGKAASPAVNAVSGGSK